MSRSGWPKPCAGMKLKHVVVTAVARDDLAGRRSGTFRADHPGDPRHEPGDHDRGADVPDFNGARGIDPERSSMAAPDIFNHNLETVERLTPLVRSRAKYRLSLRRAARARNKSPRMVTKSGIMLGLGETEPELFQAMDDLREAGVQVLTMGQYLRPTPQHLPVVEYIHPDQFAILSGHRLRERLRACLLRAAGAQFLSRGGLSSGGAEAY